MKKYLFGLGAMLVGAGLMFVFTHTEVRAESEVSNPEEFVCSEKSVRVVSKHSGNQYFVFHCETKNMECALGVNNVSCVKKGIF